MYIGKYICSKLPKSYVETLKLESKYAGMEHGFDEFITYFYGALAIGATLNFLFLYFVIRITFIYSMIPTLFIILSLFSAPYLFFTTLADTKKREIESVLPDILLLTSANIKSGLTIDRAILFSARPEFGILSDHFKAAAFKIYGGNSVEDSLQNMMKKIKSDTLEHVIDLLAEGIKSGGSIAKLLEETALDIRNSETLQREIKSTVAMYVMFIIIAGVIGAPILFAVSTYMVTAIGSMWGQQAGGPDTSEMTSSSGSFLTISSPAELDPQTFSNFAMAAILITTFFSGLLISIIQTGSPKQGIKYAPILMAAAMALFLGAKAILWSVFGSMLGL
ncbi:MAG: type II secretion system F family protein [Nanoarchaeota archaeon]|nr:type II secretion system F family protein [Nanoarchaeota archaeon]MBU4299970.1 type II secretion system F family protein [Nanoarchaeota archaeon]MBU4452588.1 type II secretion system F family protein [Nanoarchaeota archaeon]MCG2724066.1 type II secretion system F family protein [archaeon]